MLKILLIPMFLLLTGAQTSQVNNYQNGTILTADQLNAEFSNLYSTINNLDDANLIVTSNIVPTKIDATIDGSGISRQVDGSLDVNVDGTTIKIVADQLVISDLPGSALLDGAITSTQIEDNTITKSDIAVTTTGITASLGNVALSNGTGASVLSFTAGMSGDLANNLVNLTTGGGPVKIALLPATNTGVSYIECETVGVNFCELEILRAGGSLTKIQFFAQDGKYRLAPGSFNFIDTPPAGTYEYKIRYSNPSATALRVLNVRLMVYEL